MATIYPRYVNSPEEFNQAVNEGRTVIIVTNPDMIPEIKKRVKKDNRATVVTKVMAGASGVGVGGLMWGCPALGPGIALVGATMLVVGGTKSLIDSVTHQLAPYRYTEDQSEGLFVLVKRKGLGSFNEKTDKIEFKERK